jgi:hypothetical protein
MAKGNRFDHCLFLNKFSAYWYVSLPRITEPFPDFFVQVCHVHFLALEYFRSLFSPFSQRSTMLAWSLTIDWICVFPTPSDRAMAIAVSPFLLLLTTSNLSSSVSIFLFLEREPEASQVAMLV